MLGFGEFGIIINIGSNDIRFMSWQSVCICESPQPLPEKVDFAPEMHVKSKCFLIKKLLCKISIRSALKRYQNKINQYAEIIHINTREHTCRFKMYWS